MKECNIVRRKSQIKTDTRQHTESDIRNAISTIYMFNAICKYVKQSHLIVNYDNTQYVFSSSTYSLLEVVTNNYVKMETYSTNNDKNFHDIGLDIKLFAIISTSGHICPHQVYVIADNDMSNDAYTVYEIYNLLASTFTGGKAYIMFCKTRAANKNFLKWLNSTILIPYMSFL